MKRTFLKYTITTTNTAQPLIGTTTTAATGPGGTDPNGDPAVVEVPVTSSAMFLNGDWVIIGSAANSDEERVRVQSVPDSTHIVLKGMAKTHLTSSFVRLAVFCAQVYVQTTAGNTGNIYIGTQGLTVSTYANVIAELVPVAATAVQPVDFSDPYYVGQDPGDVGEYWITGTGGDGYLPTVTIV